MVPTSYLDMAMSYCVNLVCMIGIRPNSELFCGSHLKGLEDPGYLTLLENIACNDTKTEQNLLLCKAVVYFNQLA